jgi:hypothetical protein
MESLSKLNPRQNRTSGNTRLSHTNINSANRCSACERVTTLTIPTTSTPGQLLFTLPNNPNSAPRTQAIASQYDSWFGVTSICVETTGNALSKNFLVIRHAPNGDPDRLPSSGNSLLNFAESYSRRGESVKLQLDSNRQAICTAPWDTVTYNKHKPINDTDPSDRNNGLFIVVSNGSPGAQPVDITIRYKYDFHFYGPIYTPILQNLSATINNSGGTPIASPFLGATAIGDSISQITNNTFQLAAGRYIVATYATGTGISAAIQLTGPGLPGGAGAFTTNLSCHRVDWNLSTPLTITCTPAATTLTVLNIIISPYDISTFE